MGMVGFLFIIYLFIHFTAFLSNVHAADCTASKAISVPSFSIPNNGLPTKVTINIPPSLVSGVSVYVEKSTSVDIWSLKANLLIDSNSFSNLGASFSFNPANNMITVDVANNVGSSGTRNKFSITGTIASIAACSYASASLTANYKRNMLIGAAAYGILSMNSASAQSSTTCTPGGDLTVYMPVGWEAKSSEDTKKDQGILVYSVSKTLSPTKKPTPPTTPSPTVSPTTATPSVSPTIAPSKSPSVAPTNPPSVPPTSAPSKSPSTTPTKKPSLSPTRNPTPPTVHPTVSPTNSPTTPFKAIITEFCSFGDVTNFIELVLHPNVSPNDIDVYFYTTNTSSLSKIAVKATYNVGSWTKVPLCLTADIYYKTFPDDTPFKGKLGVTQNMGIGISYQGAMVEFMTTSATTLVATDGLFQGQNPVKRGTQEFSGGSDAFVSSIGNRANISTYVWTMIGAYDEFEVPQFTLGSLPTLVEEALCPFG